MNDWNLASKLYKCKDYTGVRGVLATNVGIARQAPKLAEKLNQSLIERVRLLFGAAKTYCLNIGISANK